MINSNRQWFATWLLRWRWALLVGALVVGVLAHLGSRRLEFDRSLENMFSPGNRLVTSYRKLKRVFGGNEIVLAVYQDDQLLDASGTGIRRSAAIRKRLSEVPGVKGVLSIDLPLGEMIVQPDNPLAKRLRTLFLGYTHGDDGKTAALVCMLESDSDTDVPRRETIDRLRQVMENLPDGLAPGLLAGEPVMVVDGFRYVEEDGRRLGVASTVLLALTIIVCFRSVRWVVIPVLVVQLTLALTRAVLSASGMKLTMVSSMLTAVVTVVGVATMVHIIVRFRDARMRGASPPEALSHVAGLVAVPIFWACSTDAVGFAALMLSDVGPVQDYGLMMAIGSLLVIVSSILVVPGLSVLGRWDKVPRSVWGERMLDDRLGRSGSWIRSHRRPVGAAAALMAGVLSTGVLFLEVETDFTKNFRSDSPIVRSYEMVETHLGGAGVLDIILPAPPHLDWSYLQRMLRLEGRLRHEVSVPAADSAAMPGLTKVISLADAIVAGAPTPIGELPSPALQTGMVTTGMALMRAQMPEFFQALYGEDPQSPGHHYVRLMLRARERQPAAAKRQLVTQVQRIAHEEFPNAEVTGFFVLLTYLIDSVLRDQWLTFGAAVAGVAGMLVFAFRSVVFALIALVPNTVPILIVLGLMGWLGLRINLGAAMIAAVSMGLSIDSSIHYITSFRRARSEGNTVAVALDQVQHTVGRAMVFSTLALIVGFSALCSSQFVPTIYFGVLVGLSMLGGLAGNLVVLPLLITVVARDG